MNLADVFTYVFIILGFVIVFIAYWLATAALFPRLTERCAERLAETPVKATILGFIVWGIALFVGFTISGKASSAPGKVFGITISLASLLLALAGSSGLALRIGQGMKSGRDEQEPWRRVLRGGTVLALTFVLPFVGWVLVMGWTFAAGFGAFLLAWPKRVKLVDSEPAAVPAAQPAAQ
jgi:MFS family permease